MFFVLYLYNNAFQFFRMGYASAMAWLLFVIVLAFTLIQFAVARRLVYYEDSRD
jgi:multiple sugar transport system permease protein